MFSAFKSKVLGKTEKKPCYLQGSYPQGFQPARPEASSMNALVVAEQIYESLKNDIRQEASTTTNTGDGQWLRDYNEATKITAAIGQLLATANVLKDKNLTEIRSNPDEAIEAMNDIVSIAVESSTDMPTIGPQQLNAVNAMIDVLQITRRAIPKLSAYLTDCKNQLQGAIDRLSITKANLEIVCAKDSVKAIREEHQAAAPGASDGATDADDNSPGMK